MNIQLVDSAGVRNIRECTFGWIDHRLLHCGFLEYLTSESLLLYFFLCLVSDKRGLSYYGYKKICKLLKMNVTDYIKARDKLIASSLITCRDSVIQVLKITGNTDNNKPENHFKQEVRLYNVIKTNS
jgi:hypothetical protein